MTAYTKKILYSSLLLLTCLSPVLGYSADVKKLHYYMGGGGEPTGNTTIFDGDLKLMSGFLNKSKDWDTTVSFNGGHTKTEEIIKDKMPNAKNVGDFTEKSYNSMIDEMIQKIESGELKSGDQLMININTHGAKRSKEATHQIALSRSTATNLTTLQGASTVSLDRMETLAKLAGDKGVKLAIIDSSCFSGNLLNINNDKVCLISATGTDQYGYAGTVDAFFFSLKFTFSGNFVGKFKKGVNLEDAFLQARESSYTPDFPMISTPEGRLVNDLIYKMISPYLSYNDKQSSDFSNLYPRSGARFEESVCQYTQNHNQLLNLLKQHESLVNVSDEFNRNEFSNLRSALEDYRNYQLKYESTLRATFEVEQEILNLIKEKFPAQEKALSRYNALDLLHVDFDKQIKFYEELLQKAVGDYSKKIWSSTLNDLKAQQGVVSSIKASLSESSKAKLKAHEEAYGKTGATKNLANRVSTEAKKVYLSLYKQQIQKTQTNPCRDFVL